MSQPDQMHRFLFANHAVRGELVNVSQTWNEVVQGHDYPQPVQQILGELLAATSLLTATLKFDGDITVQLQGDGALKMAVINGNNQQEMRGLARIQGEISGGSSLKEMVGNGYLVITIAPREGEPYQGVVGLEGDTLTACLEDYFMRSEQLPTRLFLRTGTDEDRCGAGGILLQVLPTQDASLDDFNHLATLTETIKTEELFGLPAHDVLWRLYHQQEVTLFDPQGVSFKCSCSHQRCGDVLRTLPPEEVDRMLREDGHIDMHCDYCGTHYLVEAVDIAAIRNDSATDHRRMH